jgi:hypothetical protein
LGERPIGMLPGDLPTPETTGPDRRLIARSPRDGDQMGL